MNKIEALNQLESMKPAMVKEFTKKHWTVEYYTKSQIEILIGIMCDK